MSNAYSFRLLARESLRGKWKVAVLAGFLAGLLGGGASSSLNLNLDFSKDSSASDYPIDSSSIEALRERLTPETIGMFIGIFVFVLLFALAIGIAFGIFASIINTGYSKFNLDIVDYHLCPEVKTLFHYFPNWKKIAGANLLRGLYIFLWTLLFCIPGIIAAYNYAMVGYIQAENPEMPARDVLAYSKTIMYGNRWRLFCLEISFFGWALLCILSFGIGFLWLVPYQSAAVAAFYRNICSTHKALEASTVPPEFP